MLQRQQEGSKQNSNASPQVEDGGWGMGAEEVGGEKRTLEMNHRGRHLLYLLPEMVLFPPLKMSSSNRDKT